MFGVCFFFFFGGGGDFFWKRLGTYMMILPQLSVSQPRVFFDIIK